MKGNPFDSAAAVEHSTLHLVEAGELVPFWPDSINGSAFAREAHTEFCRLVTQAPFPCIGAKAALNEGSYGFAVYENLGGDGATSGLARDLCAFVQSDAMSRSEYSTFVAVFGAPVVMTELEFEQRLWQQLHHLHRADAAYFRWDDHVSSDPRDSQFSFSFGGQAFYVIGMHANSSRQARRFRWPTLVFNPHEQFERLRTEGKWKRMQKTIRARDVALQGNVNPMLSDFGERSEARQYSGRAVPEDWRPPLPENGGKCPFGH